MKACDIQLHADSAVAKHNLSSSSLHPEQSFTSSHRVCHGMQRPSKHWNVSGLRQVSEMRKKITDGEIKCVISSVCYHVDALMSFSNLSLPFYLQLFILTNERNQPHSYIYGGFNGNYPNIWIWDNFIYLELSAGVHHGLGQRSSP